MMKNTVIYEVRKLLRDPYLLRICLIAISFIAIGFIFDAFKYINYDLSDLQSASNMWILVIGNSNSIKQRLFLDIYLLLAVPLILGDSYLSENELNIVPLILSRTTLFSRFFSKAITALVCSIIVIAIPLMIDQLFCLSCYPIYGYQLWGNSKPTYSIWDQVNATQWSEIIRLNYPYIYNMIFVMINTLLALSFGYLSQIVSFLIRVKNKIVIVLTPAILFNFITLFLAQLGVPANNLIHYLTYPSGIDASRGVLYPLFIIVPLVIFELVILCFLCCFRRTEND